MPWTTDPNLVPGTQAPGWFAVLPLHSHTPELLAIARLLVPGVQWPRAAAPTASVATAVLLMPYPFISRDVTAPELAANALLVPPASVNVHDLNVVVPELHSTAVVLIPGVPFFIHPDEILAVADVLMPTVAQTLITIAPELGSSAVVLPPALPIVVPEIGSTAAVLPPSILIGVPVLTALDSVAVVLPPSVEIDVGALTALDAVAVVLPPVLPVVAPELGSTAAVLPPFVAQDYNVTVPELASTAALLPPAISGASEVALFTVDAVADVLPPFIAQDFNVTAPESASTAAVLPPTSAFIDVGVLTALDSIAAVLAPTSAFVNVGVLTTLDSIAVVLPPTSVFVDVGTMTAVDSTAAVLPPFVAQDYNVTAPELASTAAVLPPAVAQDYNVTAPELASTAAVLPPSALVNVGTLTTLDSTADVLPPVVTTSVTVIALESGSTAVVLPPTSVFIDVGTMTALDSTADVLPPTPAITYSVTAIELASTAVVIIPTSVFVNVGVLTALDSTAALLVPTVVMGLPTIASGTPLFFDFTALSNTTGPTGLPAGWSYPNSGSSKGMHINSGLAVGNSFGNYGNGAYRNDYLFGSDNHGVTCLVGTPYNTRSWVIQCIIHAAATGGLQCWWANANSPQIYTESSLGTPVTSRASGSPTNFSSTDVVSFKSFGKVKIGRYNGVVFLKWWDSGALTTVGASNRLPAFGLESDAEGKGVQNVKFEDWGAAGYSPSKITKDGNAPAFGGATGVWTAITNWLLTDTNDTNYNSSTTTVLGNTTILSGNGFQVIGGTGCVVTITASIPFTGNTGGRANQVRIKVNGTVVATGSTISTASGTCTATASGITVNGEDVVTVEACSTGAGTAGTITASTPTVTLT